MGTKSYERNSSSKVILASMLCGTFVAAVSQSMLTTALPSVMHDFGVHAVLGQLLTTAYIYTLGIVAAFSAFLITRFKNRNLFFAALSVFIIGCILSFLSQQYVLLLLSRLLQACGAGILLPLIQVVALQMSPKSEYGKSLGIVGLVFGFAPVIGPTLSGVITDLLGWRAIFLILGGLALLILIISFFVIHALQDAESENSNPLNKASMLLYTFGLIFFMLGVTGLENYGFMDYRAIVPTVAGLLLLLAFIIRDSRNRNPYLKIALFKNRIFATGVFLLMLAQVVLMGSAVQMPLLLQEIHGFTATVSGLILLPGALCNPILSPITGRMHDRYGGKLVSICGFLFILAGTFSFVFFTEMTPIWVIVVMYMLRMIGVAFILMPMTAYSMSDLDKSDLPHGSAIVNSFRQLAGSLGASILITITVTFSHGSMEASGVTIEGFSISFWILSAVLLVGLLTSIIAVKSKPKN